MRGCYLPPPDRGWLGAETDPLNPASAPLRPFRTGVLHRSTGPARLARGCAAAAIRHLRDDFEKFFKARGTEGVRKPSWIVRRVLVAHSVEIDAQPRTEPWTPIAAYPRSKRNRSGDLTDEDLDGCAERLLAMGARAVAAAEGLGTRTLLRRLAASGTNARSLVMRVRRERALRLLATSMPYAEVAVAIGISGPISLARFCRREFATTPGRLRAYLLRQETPSRIRCLRCGTKCQWTGMQVRSENPGQHDRAS